MSHESPLHILYILMESCRRPWTPLYWFRSFFSSPCIPIFPFLFFMSEALRENKPLTLCVYSCCEKLDASARAMRNQRSGGAAISKTALAFDHSRLLHGFSRRSILVRGCTPRHIARYIVLLESKRGVEKDINVSVFDFVSCPPANHAGHASGTDRLLF